MKKLTLVVCVFMLTFLIVNAQTKQITGTVTSADDGLGMPGVSVVIKGTTVGSSTDIDGKYILEAAASDILVFSFVGMVTQEIPVGDKSVIDVVLLVESIGVEEVIVTAVGIKRSEKSLGYSATSVKSDEFNKTAPSNIMSGVTGKVAGVQISSSSGAPGASTKVVLRGYSSVGGNNQPLYVVDGVPMNNSTAGTGTLNDAVDFGNRAGDINPDDVESMTILKGASATALYGSRAANGVIMIVTKSGSQSDKLNVSISSSVEFSQVANLPDFQNEFGQGWDAVWRSDENGSWGPRFDGKLRPWGNTVDNSQLVKPFVAQKDNLKDFFDIGKTYKNSISVSGGGDKTTFYASYSNVSADGFIPTDADEYTRNTFALKGTHEITEQLKISASVNYVVKTANAVAVGQQLLTGGEPLMGEIYQLPRDFSLVDGEDYNSTFYNFANFYTPYASNPYQSIGENSNSQRENRIYGNVGLTYELTPEITLSYKLGTDVANTHIKQSSNAFSYKGTNNSSKQDLIGGQMEKERYNSEVNSDLLVTFKKDLNEDFNLNLIAGWNVNQRDFRTSYILVNNLDIPDFDHITNSASTPIVEYFESQRRIYGVFSQADIAFRNYLFLNVVARNDWSSTLPSGDNSFFYPGVGLTFIATDAIPELSKVFSFAKLRASWGKTGNDADPYSLVNTLAKGNVSLGFGDLRFPMTNPVTGQKVMSWEVSNELKNPNIKPELTTEIEVGADLRFFNGRLGIDFAWYKKNTKDQITNVDLPSSSGYTSRIANLGEIQNKGIEAALSINPVKGKLTWNALITFTRNRSKVISLLDGITKLDLAPVNAVEYRAEVGKPLGVYYGQDFERDPSGNIVVNPANGMPNVATDNVYFGDSNYDFTMGMNNTFSYKGFDLSFSLDWRQGGLMYSRTSYYMSFTGNGPLTTYNDRETWVVPGSVVDNGDGTYSENTTPIAADDLDSGFWTLPGMDRARVVDKSFVKLRELTLGYTIPKNITSKFGLERVNLSVYGRNLITWRASENKFVDPEATTFGNDLTSEYGEYAGMPSSRSYGISLKVNF